MTGTTALSALSLAIWLYLLLLHGRFWWADQRLDRPDPESGDPAAGWPQVVAVVPARNEADVLDRSLGSLIAQDYPGLERSDRSNRFSRASKKRIFVALTVNGTD